jgi:hypothetical protein
LGIPRYAPDDRLALFRIYAPVWQIQYGGNDDRIGWPFWGKEGRIGVDTDRATTFMRLSFTRFGQTVLPQLNYIIWFPSRPKRSFWDIYGGVLDGLNYRVTLDLTGKPILYETVHNCGCYYKAYPTMRLHRRSSIAYAEKPLILEAPGHGAPSTRMVVAMERGTHYVRHLYWRSSESQPEESSYALVDYDRLKSLPHPSGRRQSMFNRYGLVAGTERLERVILWPTGVLSPGAMRQWGKHAVAFAGRRHFDDPFYMEKMFVLRDQPRTAFAAPQRP